MEKRDLGAILADAGGGGDIFPRPYLQCGTQRQPGKDRHHESGDGDDGGEASRADEGAEHHRREDRRHGEDDVADAHDHGFGKAAQSRDRNADRRADEGTDGDGGDGGGERVPRAGHQHGEHITAEMIRAETAINQGRFQLLDDLYLGRRKRRPDQRQKGDGDKKAGDGDADDEGRAAAKQSHHRAPARNLGSMKR